LKDKSMPDQSFPPPLPESQDRFEAFQLILKTPVPRPVRIRRGVGPILFFTLTFFLGLAFYSSLYFKGVIPQGLHPENEKVFLLLLLFMSFVSFAAWTRYALRVKHLCRHGESIEGRITDSALFQKIYTYRYGQKEYNHFVPRWGGSAYGTGRPAQYYKIGDRVTVLVNPRRPSSNVIYDGYCWWLVDIK
jgi:hypothetical protein